ncbi:hypothetical protein [Pseudorhodoferax sp. Leaf265]|uniref:hypothetical protein n=1 Tax=Pseudorhodoferax sp. Leaf265 TaxID=1736315 RepID=UPI0006F7C355|nr:hypothetical protein [Pseudorhodoferax sp. Leaf265]KQP21380.1 hypothetical protein ASF45_04185 [Pseudorhodoferax sp. Leaf265]
MEFIRNIQNRLRICFGNPSPAELATMSMPTEDEIRQAECLASHQPSLRVYKDTESSWRISHIFPDVRAVAHAEGMEMTPYALWYVRVMEIWGARQEDVEQQAIREMSYVSEAQLELDQTRHEMIELLVGKRARFARSVAGNYRANVPAYRKRYPEQAIA